MSFPKPFEVDFKVRDLVESFGHLFAAGVSAVYEDKAYPWALLGGQVQVDGFVFEEPDPFVISFRFF